MKITIKELLKWAMDSMGLEIRKKPEFVLPFNFLETILETVLSYEKKINIVQIGANDGVFGDPIHNFVMENKKFTNALLIEPQNEIIKYLKHAYSTHPNILIYNGAIGFEDNLLLYRIKPDLWRFFNAPYLKYAPEYRAPSGVTSANREHVFTAAKKYLDNNIEIEDALEKLYVPCKRLRVLLSEMKFPDKIHLLQIDTEGMDDQVIYASDIDYLQPTLINFESKNLNKKNKYKLEEYLSQIGYRLYNWNKSDTIAIKKMKN